MHTRRPTCRLTRLLLLAAVCGACALASASASAIVPPPGTPDLSQMVLAPSDFTSGARITTQGYVRADRALGEIADYQRNLAGSTAASGAKFADVFSEVALVEDTFSAAQFFAAGKDVFRSPRFQRQFAREIIRAVSRRARVRSRDIRFGSVRSLHVGDESILQPVSVRVHGVRSSGDRISLRVDCAVGGLELWGVPGGRISFGEASGLAGKMADRMRTGFSVAPMIFVAPTIGVLPKVTGKKIIEEMAAQGQTLIITGNGTWSNCPTGFTYQWERCDAAGANCAAVGAAFGDAVAEVSRQFYTLTAADVGARVRVSVTAMNAAGPSKAATSTPTVVIR